MPVSPSLSNLSSLGFGSPPPSPHNLAPLPKLCLRCQHQPARTCGEGMRPHAMLPMSRLPSSASGRQFSAARSIWSSTIPTPSFINSIPLGRRASYMTRASVPTWPPGIYTLQDLVKTRPHQPPDADKSQRNYTHEDINTRLSPTEGVSCLPQSSPPPLLHPTNLGSCG